MNSLLKVNGGFFPFFIYYSIGKVYSICSLYISFHFTNMLHTHMLKRAYRGSGEAALRSCLMLLFHGGAWCSITKRLSFQMNSREKGKLARASKMLKCVRPCYALGFGILFLSVDGRQKKTTSFCVKLFPKLININCVHPEHGYCRFAFVGATYHLSICSPQSVPNSSRLALCFCFLPTGGTGGKSITDGRLFNFNFWQFGTRSRGVFVFWGARVSFFFVPPEGQ